MADADQVRGKLAGKIQARERESEAQIELPSDPVSAASREERQARTWLPTVLIWTVAIVVGLATGSVALGLGALVLAHLLLQGLRCPAASGVLTASGRFRFKLRDHPPPRTSANWRGILNQGLTEIAVGR